MYVFVRTARLLHAADLIPRPHTPIFRGWVVGKSLSIMGLRAGHSEMISRILYAAVTDAIGGATRAKRQRGRGDRSRTRWFRLITEWNAPRFRD